MAIFQKILHRDLSKFFLIYSIFLIGFSQAFYIAMIPQNKTSSDRLHLYSFSTPLNSIYTVIIMSLGESHIVYDEFETMQTNKFVTTVLYVVYLIIVSLLLVNMLIAMMNSSYQNIAVNIFSLIISFNIQFILFNLLCHPAKLHEYILSITFYIYFFSVSSTFFNS